MSKPSLLIWGGPVFADTPTKVAWQSPVDIIAVTGNGSTYFSNLGEQYRGSDGRILRNLVAANGKNLDDYGKVALAGFSAFHGLANLILDADSDLVDAMVSLDSCFSAIDHPAKRGYSKFAKKAARGSALFLLTAGPGGGPGSGATLGPGGVDFSSAIDCVMASTEGTGLRSFTPPDFGFQPRAAYKSGDLIVLDLRDYIHQTHINGMAIPLMDLYLSPYLAQTFSTFAVNLGVGAVSAALGWLAYSYLLLPSVLLPRRRVEHPLHAGHLLEGYFHPHLDLRPGQAPGAAAECRHGDGGEAQARDLDGELVDDLLDPQELGRVLPLVLRGREDDLVEAAQVAGVDVDAAGAAQPILALGHVRLGLDLEHALGREGEPLTHHALAVDGDDHGHGPGLEDVAYGLSDHVDTVSGKSFFSPATPWLTPALVRSLRAHSMEG